MGVAVDRLGVRKCSTWTLPPSIASPPLKFLHARARREALSTSEMRTGDGEEAIDNDLRQRTKGHGASQLSPDSSTIHRQTESRPRRLALSRIVYVVAILCLLFLAYRMFLSPKVEVPKIIHANRCVLQGLHVNIHVILSSHTLGTPKTSNFVRQRALSSQRHSRTEERVYEAPISPLLPQALRQRNPPASEGKGEPNYKLVAVLF